MIKNIRVHIKPLQNGYLVERSWREVKEGGDALDYTYKEIEFMFATWDEVVEWVKNNAIEIPAQA